LEKNCQVIKYLIYISQKQGIYETHGNETARNIKMAICEEIEAAMRVNHPDALDQGNQTLSVNKSAGRINGEVKVTRPKTANSVRTICLLKETVNLLVQEHAKHPGNPIILPSPVTGKIYGPDCLGGCIRPG